MLIRSSKFASVSYLQTDILDFFHCCDYLNESCDLPCFSLHCNSIPANGGGKSGVTVNALSCEKENIQKLVKKIGLLHPTLFKLKVCGFYGISAP